MHGVRDQIDDDKPPNSGVPVFRASSGLVSIYRLFDIDFSKSGVLQTVHAQQHSDNTFTSNPGGIHPTIAVHVGSSTSERQSKREREVIGKA